MPTITGTGAVGSFTPKSAAELGEISCTATLDGTGVATIQLEKQPPGSSVWYPIYAASTQLYVWNYTGNPIEEDFSESVPGTTYRYNCTSFTSGSINANFYGGVM